MTTESPMRFARIESAADAIAAYMPANYRIVSVTPDVPRDDRRWLSERGFTIIAGRDECGWTLDDYVLPRLASGMYFGREIPADELDQYVCEHDVTLTLGCAECAVASGEWRFTDTGEMERV